MKETDLISTLTVHYTSTGEGDVAAGAATVAAGMAKAEAAAAALGSATETSSRRQASAAAAFNAFARSVDPAARAYADLERNLKTFGQAMSQNSSQMDKAGQSLTLYAEKLHTALVAAEALRRSQSNLTTDPAASTGSIKGTPMSLNQITGSTLSNVNTKTYAAEYEAMAKAQDMAVASALRLRTAINPLEAEQGRLGVETAHYRDLLKQNVITQDEFNAHQIITSKRLSDFAQNLKQAGTAGRVMSGEMTNLGFQLNDVVTGLALGQSPFMIMAQQGGQIVQIFANSKSSIADFARSSVAWLGSLMTPLNGIIAGAVIATGVIAKLAADFDKLQVSSQRALIGAGERTGTTVTDLNKFTEQNSGVNTTGLSNKEARSLAEDLTKTGEIVVSQLHNMSAAVVGFANQSGLSIEDARKAFVGFAVDPKKGLDELTKTFGDVDVETRKLVDAFVIAGDKTEALNVLVDALADRSKRAAENMTVLDQAGRGFNTFFNREIAGTKPTGIEDQLAAAQAAMANAQHALSAGLQQGDSSDVLNVLSQRLAKATAEVEKFKAASDAISTSRATAQLTNLSTAAEAVVKSLTPEMDQIEQLQKKIQALNLAKTFGAPSKEGTSVDDAALVKAQNQLAATQESQAQAARYNLEVQNISSSWGHVGQAVALQLQAMQNSLPVAREWTEAGKMKAQYEATYLDLLNQGKTQQEAQAVAAKQEELSKAAAVASAQKLVQSSQDNLNAIRAQGTGMEDVLASSVAYRDAIQAGATATQAAAIAANTLSAGFERAAQAAKQVALAETQALNGSQFQQLNSVDANGILDVTRAGHSQFDPSVMPKGPLSFSGSTDAGANELVMLLQQQRITENAGIGGLAGTAYSDGGIAGALAAIKNAPGTFGAPSWMNQFQSSGGHSSPIDFTTLLGAERSTTEDKISNYDQIVQLQNAQTTDKGTQIANLKAEMDWMQTLPETISRDLKIISLQQSIDSLKNATDANTAATQATLNPLYSQGHGALAIGYYKAAAGLDMVAQGPTSGDQIPFHAMINGGERVRIGPADSMNDNSRQTTIVQNFFGQSTSNQRRNKRQAIQGFAQSIAAAG